MRGRVGVSGALLVSAVILVFAACASRPTADQPKLSLSEFIDQQIGTSPYDRGVWGIRVEDEQETVLYERNSEVLMVPASNRKTFVAALASYCLGLDATFETELWLDGVQGGSVLEGDLVVRGGGDPSLGGRLEADRDRRLMPYLEALRGRGIGQVTGGIVADPSRFDRERLLGSWEIEDIGTSSASPVDALTFNEGIAGVLVDGCGPNSVTLDPSFPAVISAVECGEQDRIVIRSDEGNRVVVTGSVKAPRVSSSYQRLLSVADPALYAAMAVDDFLRRNGIVITAAPAVTLTPRGSERIAAVVSPPLFMLLASYMEESINLWGDVILKNLSAGSSPGSFAGSLREEEWFLSEIVGIDPSAFEFADGSGLSTRNKVTPAAIVRLLGFMDRSPMRGAFREMFAEPGELGTMRTRLTDLKGRLLVKTGTINGVRALSGMVAGDGGRTRYFSILVNHYSEDLPLAREAIDAIVRAIAEVSDE